MGLLPMDKVCFCMCICFYCISNIFQSLQVSGKNLSHSLSYAATQMATAYSNNVQCHFDKYVKRTVRTEIRALFFVEKGVSMDSPNVPKHLRKEFDKDVHTVAAIILESKRSLDCKEHYKQWIINNPQMMMPLLDDELV